MSRKYDLDPLDPEHPYLVVDRDTTPPDVTATYDGKHSCWVPSNTDGYVAARILDNDDGKVIEVKTERGDVRVHLILM